LAVMPKQHDTNTQKDDIFVQEFSGKVPRYWVMWIRSI